MPKEEFLEMVLTELEKLKEEKRILNNRLNMKQEQLRLKIGGESGQLSQEISNIQRQISLIEKKTRLIGNLIHLPAVSIIEQASDIELESYKKEIIEEQEEELKSAQESLKKLQEDLKEAMDKRAEIEEEYSKTKKEQLLYDEKQIEKQIEKINNEIIGLKAKIKTCTSDLERIKSYSHEQIRSYMLSKTSHVFKQREPSILERLMAELEQDPKKSGELLPLIQEYQRFQTIIEKEKTPNHYRINASGYVSESERIGNYTIERLLKAKKPYGTTFVTADEVIECAQERYEELQEAAKLDEETFQNQRDRFSYLYPEYHEAVLDDSFPLDKFEEFSGYEIKKSQKSKDIDGENVSMPSCTTIGEAIAELKRLKDAVKTLEGKLIKTKKRNHQINVYYYQIELLKDTILLSLKAAMKDKYFCPELKKHNISTWVSDNVREMSSFIDRYRFGYVQEMKDMYGLIQKCVRQEEARKSRLEIAKYNSQQILGQIRDLGGLQFEGLDETIQIPKEYSGDTSHSVYEAYQKGIEDASATVFAYDFQQKVEEEAKKQAQRREEELKKMVGESGGEDSTGAMASVPKFK